MSTATVDQWKIVLWKLQGVQRIKRNAAFAMHPCIMATQWHCPSCVTTRCCHEGPGSLEEQMADISLIAWPDCHGAVLHLQIIPWSHKCNSNVA